MTDHVIDAALKVILALVLVFRVWVKRRSDQPRDEERRRTLRVEGETLAALQREIEGLKARMDRASAELSRLAGIVNRLPEEMRREYVPREIAKEWIEQFKRLRDTVEGRRGWRDET